EQSNDVSLIDLRGGKVLASGHPTAQNRHPAYDCPTDSARDTCAEDCPTGALTPQPIQAVSPGAAACPGSAYPRCDSTAMAYPRTARRPVATPGFRVVRVEWQAKEGELYSTGLSH